MMAMNSPAVTVSDIPRIASRGGRLTRNAFWSPEVTTMLPTASPECGSTVPS
jgi:hypothetical protein